jgi:adenosylcobyric acid synthase
MIQGTASHVGKTVLVAAVCRILSKAGFKVAPFKSQNMSLNSYVTTGGKEIARAQALQALAAGIEPRAEMNPVLLKPKGNTKSQVVLLGEPYRDITARNYYDGFAGRELLGTVEKSLEMLLSEFEVVVIEGAGSPAELNLYDSDIANMRIAEHAESPVFLVGDIDKGGVFASLFGTLSLLRPPHKELVKGFIINKFRGDISILEPGLRQLEAITRKPVLGVIPYVDGLVLPWEDSVSLESSDNSTNVSDFAVIKFPHISNFTDFDSLRVAGTDVRFVDSASQLGRPAVVILPGTKNTIHDLQWLKKEGFDGEILRLRKEGVPIIGICGGYQILGNKIMDPYGIEGGTSAEYDGLGLLDVTTTFERYEKTTKRVNADVIGGGPILGKVITKRIRGFEIHMGESKLGKDKPPFMVHSDDMKPHPEGAISSDGIVLGSYLHGMFDDEEITGALLDYLTDMKRLSSPKTMETIEASWLRSLDTLCRSVLESVDVDRIFEMAGVNTGARLSWSQYNSAS